MSTAKALGLLTWMKPEGPGSSLPSASWKLPGWASAGRGADRAGAVAPAGGVRGPQQEQGLIQTSPAAGQQQPQQSLYLWQASILPEQHLG